jgi:hypothetical protein
VIESKREGLSSDAESRQEIERGFQFANMLNSLNTDQNRELMAVVRALTEILLRNGITHPGELHELVEEARRGVGERPLPSVCLMDMGDKYAEGQFVDIDCASLMPVCQARCCSFAAILTEQDLNEGIARWDYGNPYWVMHTAAGFCVHADRKTGACTIHPRRPHACRTFDCRKDKRIWLDFEHRVLAPQPASFGVPPVGMLESMVRKTQSDEQGRDP